LRALADADPQDARPPGVRKAAGRLHAQRERGVSAAALGDAAADLRHVSQVHLAEEQQRDVQVLRLDPLDLGAGAGQGLLQRDDLVADALADVHGDEGADAGHARISFQPAASASSQNCRVPWCRRAPTCAMTFMARKHAARAARSAGTPWVMPYRNAP